MVDPPWHTTLIRALTRTSMPCPIGSSHLSEVRDLVHAADSEVSETIKFTNRPYFVLQGNICALLAAMDHVNVFLYDGAIVPDPEGIITGGHNNTTARTVAIREGETVNALALQAMFKQIIANNRAGGWRTLKRES
jgi:hypothetical protein